MNGAVQSERGWPLVQPSWSEQYDGDLSCPRTKGRMTQRAPPAKIADIANPISVFVHHPMMDVADVDADGECFYRCLVCCIRRDRTLYEGLSLSAVPGNAISQLREHVAYHIRGDPEVREWIRALLLTMKRLEDPEVVAGIMEDNPLLYGARSLQGISDNITLGKAWASQTEVGIVRRSLGAYGIGLVVVEGESPSAADQLLAALDKLLTPRCIVLVRVHNCHYRFLRMQRLTIFNTAWLVYGACCMAMLQDDEDQLF